jgi:hypothetical protein
MAYAWALQAVLALAAAAEMVLDGPDFGETADEGTSAESPF